MSEIQIPAKDGSGSFSAYIAMPEVTPAPAIIVIQEIFGVNKELRDKCDSLAEQGYIAICPDLFWRIEPGVQLTDQSEEEWEKAFNFFNNFDVDLGVEDLAATNHTIKGHANSNGKVACIGYCLGGKLAYLMAARTTINASVSYYGVGLDELLSEADTISNALMLHIAEEDEYVSKDAQTIIKEGLKGHPTITIHSYAGANHAFARGGGIHYDEALAKEANERTSEFIKNHLG
jgi:carboxymethylenebutenolidase